MGLSIRGEAVRRLIPETGKGIEIGVGTGRFSIPFGIKVGVEPAKAMAEIARKRGITVYDAKQNIFLSGIIPLILRSW